MHWRQISIIFKRNIFWINTRLKNNFISDPENPISFKKQCNYEIKKKIFALIWRLTFVESLVSNFEILIYLYELFELHSFSIYFLLASIFYKWAWKLNEKDFIIFCSNILFLNKNYTTYICSESWLCSFPLTNEDISPLLLSGCCELKL